MTASGDHDGTTVSVGGRAGRNNRLIGVGGVTLAVTMIGLTYGAAPFYTAFCRATGYEGTPQQVKANTDAEGHRVLRVGFDANVAPGLDWSFEPESELVRLRTGKTVTVFFRARNLSDKPTEARATFNVTPGSLRGIFRQDLVLLLHDPAPRPARERGMAGGVLPRSGAREGRVDGQGRFDHAVLYAVRPAVRDACAEALGRSRRAGGLMINGRRQ